MVVVIRRGRSDMAHLCIFQPDEYGLDTDRGTLRVGDGHTPGGIPIDYKGGNYDMKIYSDGVKLLEYRPVAVTKEHLKLTRVLNDYQLFYCAEEQWLYYCKNEEWHKVRSCKEFEAKELTAEVAEVE